MKFFSVLLIFCFTFPVMSNNRPWRPNGLAASDVPPELATVGITEHLGKKLDLNLKFKNDKGEDVTLGKYINGNKPIMLSLVYYSCPHLCNFHLNGVTEGLKSVKWTLGQEFEMLVLSIDPKETPSLAEAKKKNYLKVYNRTGAEQGWHFLTGSQEQISALAETVGFKYRWDKETKQWAHSSAVILLTPEGVISRYLYGIEFDQKNLTIGLLEAAQGKLGDVIDRLILYCFQYDPERKTYAFYAYNIMRASMGLMALAMAFFLIPFWMKQRREKLQTDQRDKA